MTFEQLLVFHKIVQVGSFKAASVQLHKTQPAISFAIKKLEEELEVELFDRSAYRPTLTSHGKALWEKSQKILVGMDELEGLARSFRHQEEPEVSVAMDGIGVKPEMLKFFKNFKERFPHTKLNLGFDILSEAERRVLSKDAQFGITHFVSERNSVEMIPFTHVTMIPVMSKELFRERKVKNEEDLLEIDQIVVADKHGDKGASFGLLENGKKWRLNDANSKRDIIFAGLGWGHLVEHSIERELKEKKLTIINFENIKPRKLEIYLIRLKKNQLGPVAQTLWDELSQFHQ